MSKPTLEAGNYRQATVFGALLDGWDFFLDVIAKKMLQPLGLTALAAWLAFSVPKNFEEEMNTPPSTETVQRAEDLPILDHKGKSLLFREVFDREDGVISRLLVIFIRHFHCGVCSLYHLYHQNLMLLNPPIDA